MKSLKRLVLLLNENAGFEIAMLWEMSSYYSQNHGLISVSKHSIDSAAFWFSALEGVVIKN